MNTRDFIVLPWGKPGNSVKLKYKNAQELRMEKVQLELENKEMERKLQELDSTRHKERDKKESSGYHWKSGQVGKLGNRSHTMSQNRGNVIKVNDCIRFFRLLHSNAIKACLECGEDFCSGCFAKIHQKGALKLHRTTLLQVKPQIVPSVLNVAHRFIKEVNPDEPKGENHTTKNISESYRRTKPLFLQESSTEVEFTASEKAESTNQKPGLLCEGSFNEEASARSFQEVLHQWRTGNPEGNEQRNAQAAKPNSMEACEVQTNMKVWREPLEIEFKEDSLSYVEKLWLKKHRRTLRDQLLNTQPVKPMHSSETTNVTPFSPNGSGKEHDVLVTKVQHPALFLPVEELKIERPEQSLKIVELDDNAYEEDFEDSGNAVSYKVELPDVDSTNCPYGNNLHPHHVFTMGKIDLLNFCLTTSSSNHRDNSKAGTASIDCDSVADPGVSSPGVGIMEENSFCGKSLTKEWLDKGSYEKSAHSCTRFESKNSLPSTDFEELSIKELLSQDIKESLDLSNLHEKPCAQDSKATESQLLLQDIALRNKPINEHYHGFEKFFIFEENERLNLLPSHSVECCSSLTRISLAGDREWIPDHSLSEYANHAVVLNVLHSNQDPQISRTQQKMGKVDNKTSTANLPLSNAVRKESSCLSPSPLPPKSATGRSLSRAASEISEIEYIDTTDHNEPLLDTTADKQAIENLEKELNELRNLADSSEKLHSLTSEELPACNSHSQNTSKTTMDCLKTPNLRVPYGVEEQSSSGKETEIESWLTLSESSADEDEEDFLDKQHVTTLPWPSNP
ncbi:zinc finger B-box domain-containing protein 1 [Echinops telfairi]|uniref:Zinc finger B-box domain-containing protein 1 n=1 Tax=Echinops telfairi TaxID=9371 RepID=A0AC55DPD2_ECHTE|nr:zinc finger B-box domain-containing protein 1 [Echinops telfairi]